MKVAENSQFVVDVADIIAEKLDNKFGFSQGWMKETLENLKAGQEDIVQIFDNLRTGQTDLADKDGLILQKLDDFEQNTNRRFGVIDDHLGFNSTRR